MTKNFKKTSLRGDSHIPQLRSSSFHRSTNFFWTSRKEVRNDRFIKKQEILIYDYKRLATEPGKKRSKSTFAIDRLKI